MQALWCQTVAAIIVAVALIALHVEGVAQWAASTYIAAGAAAVALWVVALVEAVRS